MDSARRPVVVGIDGSAASLSGVTVAAREAALRAAPLRLVYAESWTEDDPDRILKEATEYALGVAHTPVSAESVPGEPGAVLAEESRTAALVVVSHRGAGGFLGLRLGSVAIAVTARASGPVLVVRGTAVRDGYVVVGVDGSPANRTAVRFAFAEAELRGARLLAVHGWLGPARHEAERFDEALAGPAARYPRVPVERQLLRARAASALVGASEGAQLVVVGTRGHGGRHGHRPVLPFGSFTHALLHHCACPTVVVPHDD